MRESANDERLTASVEAVLNGFQTWMEAYGETSWDHQSFFAGAAGRWAKSLYYRNKLAGTMAVAPMVFCEAFWPSARRLFHYRIRLPIADAHYAMGYAFLYERTGDPRYLEKGCHFLEELKKSRCPGYREWCWGYPFDWMTRTGVIRQGTPLITTTPYVYEAFLKWNQLQPRDEWKEILRSIARHAVADLTDTPTSERASCCSYGPGVEGRVINASAYRAFLLLSAAQEFGEKSYRAVAERNLNFVLENQNSDGSWPYAMDGVRDFVDHFHTCFVMKALAKVHGMTGHPGCRAALERGLPYYVENLFGEDGVPRPFSKAPRITVYRAELYDCAESINLLLLVKREFPAVSPVLRRVIDAITRDWVKRDGSFRSRRLMFGWDEVPMHRWGQSQMFRSLAYYQQDAATAAQGDCLQNRCVA